MVLKILIYNDFRYCAIIQLNHSCSGKERYYMNELVRDIEALKPELIELRKGFHRRPELGFREFQTSRKVAEYLEVLGLDVRTGIAGTGVLALLRGTLDGPTVGIRACLDALPIEEQSGVDYTSEYPGVMHACGHDGNMTMVLGSANWLSKHKQLLHGNVKFIFQPSEEETGGAAKMIEAGCLKDPDVDVIVTPHNWHGYEQGEIIVTPGPVLASSDLFKLEIIGTPGHGAWPDMAVDPIPVAAELITTLQRIISREISPLKPAVLSIGKINGGTAVNIIPECVTIEGTVRTFDKGTRDFMQSRIDEIADHVTKAARASYHLEYQRVMPPAYNDPKLASTATRLIEKTLDTGNVADACIPDMGCEEFSLFQEQVPGLFMFIGNDRKDQPITPIHSPKYIFNDDILTVGVQALCAIAVGYLASE